ncbi:hypothetical protein EXW96_21835 [Paenibacillus sp. JMULE4]|uniref:hypothetical protein n=1 Tax=Paenibacillus sp. JMULE4 TaxID=2518342 RepID=UPI0015763884|nr:hypothetical protein [Paenibacillus sp. JMULE4]NTZ20093.1 hypothetical protein [Paenibacillus sp. JMULE4]
MASKKAVSSGLAGVLVLSAMLSGCSGGGEPAPAGGNAQGGGGQPADQAVSLSIWTGWPELDPYFKKMAEEYKKQSRTYPLRSLLSRCAITKRRWLRRFRPKAQRISSP